MPLTRRRFLGVLGAAVAVPLVPTTREPTRYGPVTVQRHLVLARQGVHLHVMHQARDITMTGVFFADDTGRGFAMRYVRDDQGRSFVVPGTRRAAIERLDGVTFQEGAPFS